MDIGYLEVKEPTFFEKVRFGGSFYFLTALFHNQKYRPHWNTITPGLILGGIPIETEFLGHGNHAEKLIEQCATNNRPLGRVVSVLEDFEREGKGLLGLKPVSATTWANKNITFSPVEMADFSDAVDLKEIKDAADGIHQTIQNNQTAYVHCKAGRGRSFTVVMCYLIDHRGLSVNEALELIVQHRSQVSPSKSQFDLIEQYRVQYCPNSAPLNPHAAVFQPYRKDMAARLKSPWLQAGIAAITGFIARAPLFVAGGAGVIIGGASMALQYLRHKLANKGVDALEVDGAIEKLSLSELKAIKAGINSGTDNWEYAASFKDLNATFYYRHFLAGMRLKQEQETDLCQEVEQAIENKNKI